MIAGPHKKKSVPKETKMVGIPKRVADDMRRFLNLDQPIVGTIFKELNDYNRELIVVEIKDGIMYLANNKDPRDVSKDRSPGGHKFRYRETLSSWWPRIPDQWKRIAG